MYQLALLGPVQALNLQLEVAMDLVSELRTIQVVELAMDLA
jgi:hypothetical protein